MIILLGINRSKGDQFYIKTVQINDCFLLIRHFAGRIYEY